MRRIQAKASAKARLGTDIDAVVAAIVEQGGSSDVPGFGDVDKQALHLGLLDSVGAPQLATALETSTRRQALRRTGWPPARWLGRLGRRREPSAVDPDGTLADLADSLVPEVGRVHRAQAESAVRELVEKASVGLARPWRDAVRASTVERGGEVVRALDTAVEKLDVSLTRPAGWWRVVQVLQLLLLVALGAGVVWWVLDLLSVVDAPPRFAGTSLAVLLAVGGLVGGILVGLVSRVAARSHARRRAAQVEDALREAVEDVARLRVLEPVAAEVSRYRGFRSAVRRAQGL